MSGWRGMKQAITFPAFFLTCESSEPRRSLTLWERWPPGHYHYVFETRPTDTSISNSRRVHAGPAGDALGAHHPLDQHASRESDCHRLQCLGRSLRRMLHSSPELVSLASRWHSHISPISSLFLVDQAHVVIQRNQEARVHYDLQRNRWRLHCQ